MSISERDEDDFDFSEMMFDEPAKKSDPMSDPTPNNEEKSIPKGELTYDKEVQTSYLLVNAMLTLLVRKQIIYPHEVQALVSELHVEYVKKKGRDGNGTK